MHQIFQSTKARRVGINEIFEHREVIGTNKTFAVRRQAITSGTTDFLRMILQTLRHVVMNHRADVRLVDAHAKRNRCHNHARLATHEGRLRRGTKIIGQSRMIRRCRKPLRLEKCRNLFGSFLPRDIDHGRTIDRRQTLKQNRFSLGRRAGGDAQIKIRPVKPERDMILLCDPKRAPDVRRNFRRRGRGQGQHSGNFQPPAKPRDLEVVRPEIVTPFGNAVGLIHRDHRHIPSPHPLAKPLVGQPLRRDVQHPQPPGIQVLIQGPQALGIHRRIQPRRRNPPPRQRLDLILHQRNQRRNHQGQTLERKRRQLITQGFAATGRKNCQHRPPGHQRPDDLGLTASQRLMAEIFPQQCPELVHEIQAQSLCHPIPCIKPHRCEIPLIWPKSEAD